MLLLIRRSVCGRYLNGFHKMNVHSTGVNQTHLLVEAEIRKITRIITDHPFPDRPLEPTLVSSIPPSIISTTFVEKVLGQLFASHSNLLKAHEFYKFSLSQSQFTPSLLVFEKILHILTINRYFSKAWELLEKVKKTHPSLLTTRSMSILLSGMAKYRTFEATLEAFEKMEKDVFCGKKFGNEEFNVLIRAFCMQRQIKEAKGAFKMMHQRFTPDVKTMNILLMGFKLTADITAMDIFHHEMIRRGFKSDNVTYSIMIDAYCKRGRFEDALRLFKEMETAGCSSCLQTITTLIKGAGVRQNIGLAKQLFCEISTRGLMPDVRAYNVFMNSLIGCGDVKSASSVMDDMVKQNILPNNITYRTMFSGLMKIRDTDGIIDLYLQMTDRKFVPRTETVIKFMNFFCKNHMVGMGRNLVDMGLNLWSYLIENGDRPHSDVLVLLVTGLCSQSRAQEAFECTKQLLERGSCPSESVIGMLSQCLPQEEKVDKLEKLESMMKQLGKRLSPSLFVELKAEKGIL